jgi:ABC-type molybdenum transport system ATPase subunit/photorepair protein PhrA
MKLNVYLAEKYKSFPPNFEAEIEGGLVLISGINGSGKTQLIDIVKGYKLYDINNLIQRKVTQDGADVDNGSIISKSFREYQGLPEISPALVSNTTLVRDQVYNWYIQSRFEYNQHTQVVQANMRGAAKLAKELVINKFGHDAFNSGNLTREDIKAVIPGDFVLYEDDIFTNKIGELFFNYVSLVYKKKAEAGENGEKFDASILPLAPWTLLNELFEKLSFGYRFKNSYSRVDDEIDEQPVIYQIKDDGTIDLSQKRALNELSDGEKALISLTFAVVASAQKKPKILLLDEYDATLNPSLIESFFIILQDFFVDKGIQVIIITHSSATLSQAPSNASFYELYRPNSKGLRLLPVNRDQYEELAIANKNFYSQIADQKVRLTALITDNDNLTSLVQTLRDSSTNKVQIITEGHNIEHIAQAITILQPDLLEKVEFVRGAEHVTGKSQMKPAFEIMANLTSNHQIVFVWDVDAKGMVDQLKETKSCTKFCFPLNGSNQKIPAGIENLYPNEFITDDLYSQKETPRNDGGKNIQIELNKKAFLGKVKNERDEKTFENYNSLISLLTKLSSSH